MIFLNDFSQPLEPCTRNPLTASLFRTVSTFSGRKLLTIRPGHFLVNGNITNQCSDYTSGIANGVSSDNGIFGQHPHRQRAGRLCHPPLPRTAPSRSSSTTSTAVCRKFRRPRRVHIVLRHDFRLSCHGRRGRLDESILFLDDGFVGYMFRFERRGHVYAEHPGIDGGRHL